MLDNLRDQASFHEEEEPLATNPPNTPKPTKRSKLRMPHIQLRSLDQITGMTALQRFALAVMLLVMVCLLGTMLLLISGRMVPLFML